MKDIIGNYVKDTIYGDIGKVIRVKEMFSKNYGISERYKYLYLIKWLVFNSERHIGDEFGSYYKWTFEDRFEIITRDEYLVEAL